MFQKIIRPSDSLREFVKYYWVIETGKEEGEVKCRVTPINSLELFFHYKNEFNEEKNTGLKFRQPRSFVSGLRTSFSDVTANSSGVIVVTFTATGAHRFFRFPMIELDDNIAGLDSVLPKEQKFIEEKITEAGSLVNRVMIIEQFLKLRLRPVKEEDIALIRQGLLYIDKNRGAVNIKSLSKKLSVFPKSLERKFSIIVGKTPKQYAKIVRFNNAMESLKKQGAENLAAAAYELGYYDQSHFIKEFKTISGYTPSEFIALPPC